MKQLTSYGTPDKPRVEGLCGSAPARLAAPYHPTRHMGGQLRRAILLASIVMGAVHSQTVLDEANPLGAGPDGIRLQSISAFTTYYSATPGLQGQPNLGLTSTTSFGVSATVSYSKFSPYSGLSIIYSPSYLDAPGAAGWHSTTQNLTFTWNRRLAAKWHYNLAASGAIISTTQALFTPTKLANVVSTPATFADLSAAFVGGILNYNQLGAILTGAPIIESPAALALYGDSLFSASVSGGLVYSHSSRLSFRANLTVARAQNLPGNAQPGSTQATPLISHTMAGTGDVGLSYGLSPRTTFSADASTSRAFSNLEDVYVNTATISLARTMGIDWFCQIQGGTGFVTAIRQVNPQPAGPQYLASGSIGYKRRAHTFMVSVSRSISDTYGLGASANISASGAWNWKRPGSSWMLSGNFAEQRLTGMQLVPIDSWTVTGGVSRLIGRRAMVTTEYAYLSAIHLANIALTQGGQQSVRLTVSWSPHNGAPR